MGSKSSTFKSKVIRESDTANAVHDLVLVLCSDAGVWSRPEAEQIYRRRLLTLKELYRGQLSRVRYQLREKRRQFLLQWQREGGQKSQGGEREVDRRVGVAQPCDQFCWYWTLWGVTHHGL